MYIYLRGVEFDVWSQFVVSASSRRRPLFVSILWILSFVDVRFRRWYVCSKPRLVSESVSTTFKL